MKKLKGVCQIELTNVDTGEKTVTTDKNIVTNAINQAFGLPLKYAIINLNPRAALYPGLTPPIDFFKGVVLLKNKINGTNEELKQTTAFPLGDAITGHAGSSTTLPDNDLTCGVFNTAESGPVENGYKYVWDFPTDRANGDISCVCLTPSQGGDYTPVSEDAVVSESGKYWHTSIGTKNVSAYNGLQPIGIHNDNLICVNTNSTEAAIYTTPLDPAIGMTSKFFGDSLLATNSECVNKHSLSTSVPGRNSRFCDGYLYQLSSDKILYKIDPETFEQVGHTVSIAPSLVSASFGPAETWIVNNEYFYCIGTDTKTIYKINLADTTDTVMITSADSTLNFNAFIAAPNDKIIVYRRYRSSSYCYVENPFFVENRSLVKTTTTYIGGSYYDNDQFISIPGNNAYFLKSRRSRSSDYNNDISLYSNNLIASTVNNLETPVTKTNATTMKIIYTVTNESEGKEE